MEYFLVCYLNSVCWYKSVWINSYCFFGIATCFSPLCGIPLKLLKYYIDSNQSGTSLFICVIHFIVLFALGILLLFCFIIIINVSRSVLSFSCVLLQNGTCYIYSLCFISLDICEFVTFFFRHFILSSYHIGIKAQCEGCLC